jgi:hypothetical protein
MILSPTRNRNISEIDFLLMRRATSRRLHDVSMEASGELQVLQMNLMKVMGDENRQTI